MSASRSPGRFCSICSAAKAERRQAAEALDAAASYHGIDIEAEVDMRRSHGRHRMIADRIEKVLHAR